MRNRFWPALLVAILVVSAGLVTWALAEGGSLSRGAPAAAAPPWPPLAVVPAAYDAAAGYDVWLFPGGATWTYGPGGWSNITATAGRPAGMGANVQMVYDARDGYVVLFGGEVAKVPFRPLAQTWRFEGGQWTNITSAVTGTPPALLGSVMSYDSLDKEIVLFGGAIPGTGQGTNATWTYAGGTWSNASVAGPPPLLGSGGDRSFIGLVDDPSDGYVLYYDSLFGCPNSCGAAWGFHDGVWTNRTAGLSGSPRLVLFDAFAWDSTAGVVVAQAGCSNTSSYTCPSSFGTFEFSGGTWKDVAPATVPAGREFSSWVDDPTDGGVMLVGGCCWADYSGFSLGWQDVWIFAHGTWSESEPWGGAPPLPFYNDGSLIAFWILGTAVVSVLYSVLPRHPAGS